MDKFEQNDLRELSNVQIQSNVNWEPKRWGVVGASGFIGSAIAKHLMVQGKEVVKIVAPRLRLGEELRSVTEISAVAAQEQLGNEYRSLLSGCDIVINAAGLATPDGNADDALYGANALLPVVLLQAAREAGVKRFIHLSSAAVQGNRSILDESVDYLPFSAYSESKALGEMALLSADTNTGNVLDLIIVRATSVQGENRQTTVNLRKISRSILASVAAPGTQPTVVSSLEGLITFVLAVGSEKQQLNKILLQPWEKVSVADVLKAAGGKSPVVLPGSFCRFVIGAGYLVSKLLPRLSGAVRRVELMWFGQKQTTSDYDSLYPNNSLVISTLKGQKRDTE